MSYGRICITALSNQNPSWLTKVYNYQCAHKPLTICYFSSLLFTSEGFLGKGIQWSYYSKVVNMWASWENSFLFLHSLNADLFYVNDTTRAGIRTSARDFIGRKRQARTKRCTGSHMCNLWRCSNLWGFGLGAPAWLPQGSERSLKDWFIPQDEVVSAALCSCKHRGESTQRTAWGKIYTGETRWDH